MSSSTIQSTVAGRYHVAGRIASGGMGEVYRAHDAVLAREVAIKVLHPQFAHDRGFVERFRREARAAAILNHPNIVGVYDWGSTDGTYFMVMEYVPGTNLRSLLAEHGRLDAAQVVEVTTQVLAALDHAHGHGIVHRDVKPENILVTRDGVVKVADFGLARAFAEASISQAEGTVTGTVQYLAPEQIQGDPADPRTDLYALGVVMFECLTGRAPFGGETSLAIAYQHLTNRVPPPSSLAPNIPPVLDRAVMHATEKDRADRPQSSRAMRDEVTRAGVNLNGSPTIADLARDLPAASAQLTPERAPTVTIPRADTPRTRRRRTRRRWMWTFLALVVAAAVGWATWAYAIPHYANVPPVKGLSVQAAQTKLENAGFKVQVASEGVPSIDVKVGDVVKTSPAVGAKTKTHTTVVVYPSTGPPIQQIPNVRGMDAELARQKLAREGFTNIVRKNVYSDAIDRGQAVGTLPKAGGKVRVTDELTLQISKGPQPVAIPHLHGVQQSDAIKTLHQDGFTTKVTHDFSADVPKGYVISTQPPKGTMLQPGKQVVVVVSKGPKLFPMPDVVFEKVNQAKHYLEGLGLIVNTVVVGNGDHIVVGQSPSKGAMVHEGDHVTLYILS
jgi:eukaryotic-like serine/threonine-protein kinase